MEKISRPSVLPTMNGDLLRRANLYRFVREFIQAANMPRGYYVEFGVLNGEAMIDAYRQLRGVISHSFGFDSFEGLPDLEASEADSRSLSPHFHKGNFKSMPSEYVRQTIQSCSRMPPDELTLVQGYFSDVLPIFSKDTMRSHGVPLVVYIDCDLYSSTRDVLDFLSDLVVTGTWLLFDDYWCYRGSPHHGEQRAIREWLATNTRLGISSYGNFNGFGRAFLVYEKDHTQPLHACD